jgi:hypothetical protein
MVKIEHVKDLPEWLIPEKYLGAKSFHAAEWYEQLAVRRYLLWLLSLPRTQVHELFAEQADLLRAFPLEAAKDLRRCAKVALQELTSEKRAVRLLIYNDLPPILRMIVAKNPSTEISEQAVLLPDFYQWDEPPKSALFRVDLNKTDTELVEGFKLALSEARNITGQAQPKTRRRPAYYRWAHYGLLPYLDLFIWAKETGSNIPLRVMADALFPFGADEDRLKDTVIPLAERLMDDLSPIRELAANESSQGSF